MRQARGKILVVDDDEYILLSLQTFLEQYYELITTVNNP